MSNNYDGLLDISIIRSGWSHSERLEGMKVYNNEHELQETAQSISENIILVIDSGFIMPALASVRFMEKEKDKYKLSLPDYIYHRNQFIFYDNKASLRWLINNDIDFLVELVRDFGYESNLSLNKAVFDYLAEKCLSGKYFHTGYLDYIFFKRDDNNVVTIRENLMKQIADSTNDLFYYQPIQMLYLYASDHSIFIDSDIDIKISAYAGYYVEIGYEKLGPSIHYSNSKEWEYFQKSFFDDIINDGAEADSGYDYIEKIRKNNYYGLPGLEDMINKY